MTAMRHTVLASLESYVIDDSSFFVHSIVSGRLRSAEALRCFESC